MSKNLLLIFTRNPELGKVKTRLAKTIGDQKALEIYKYLLNHTQKVTENTNCDKAVYYSVEIWEDDIWNQKIYQKHLQQDGDLGDRMKKAFSDGFSAGYEKIVVIGSDLYELTSEDINIAFKELDTNDAVIGPATDGGYYLLGMKKLFPEAFKNKAWGTETVLNDTLNNFISKNVKLLDKKNDIDVWNDLREVPYLVEKFIK